MHKLTTLSASLLSFGFSLGGSALAAPLTWGSLPKDATGKVIAQTLENATRSCRQQGMRLPSVREWLVHLGRPIAETRYPMVKVNEAGTDDPVGKEAEAMRSNGYEPVIHYLIPAGHHEPVGSAVYFYVQTTGYTPSTDLRKLMLWTSECVSFNNAGDPETDCLYIDGNEGVVPLMDSRAFLDDPTEIVTGVCVSK